MKQKEHGQYKSKMENKKIIYKAGILVGILILLTSSVLAFAVSSKYYEGYPMYIPVGETQNTHITLQNLASTEDVRVRANIISGGEVIELTDSSNEYLIPAGQKTTVNMKITIPSDAKLQEVYNVDIQFTTITTSESGTFGLSSGIGKGFKVIVGTGAVTEKPVKWNTYLIIGIIILIVLALVILLIRKNKKK